VITTSAFSTEQLWCQQEVLYQYIDFIWFS
jgi:hypothetical protein